MQIHRKELSVVVVIDPLYTTVLQGDAPGDLHTVVEVQRVRGARKLREKTFIAAVAVHHTRNLGS